MSGALQPWSHYAVSFSHAYILSEVYKNSTHAQFVKGAHIPPELRPYLLSGTDTSHIRTAWM